MNTKHTVTLIVFLLALIVAITWPGQPAVLLKDNSLQVLRVGTNVWPGYEPLYLARSLGLYDQGSVRLVECSSASQVMRAFRNNTIEVAALTLDEVLLLKEGDFDIRIILVTDISHGGDAVLSKPEFTQLQDLRGRTVGVESTALGAFVLTRALQTGGLTVSEVDVLRLPVDEHERAYDGGQIDAVVTFEPVRTRLLAKGATQLFDSSQIPGEIVDVLAIRQELVESHAEQLRLLLQGWFAGLKQFRDQPEEASKLMAGRMQLQPAQVLSSFEGLQLPGLAENLELLSGTQLTEAATQLARVMGEQSLLQQDVDLSQLVSLAPLTSLTDP